MFESLFNPNPANNFNLRLFVVPLKKRISEPLLFER